MSAVELICFVAYAIVSLVLIISVIIYAANNSSPRGYSRSELLYHM